MKTSEVHFTIPSSFRGTSFTSLQDLIELRTLYINIGLKCNILLPYNLEMVNKMGVKSGKFTLSRNYRILNIKGV